MGWNPTSATEEEAFAAGVAKKLEGVSEEDFLKEAERVVVDGGSEHEARDPAVGAQEARRLAREARGPRPRRGAEGLLQTTRSK